MDTFWQLFHLPRNAAWDVQLHGVTAGQVATQAQLPMRFGGMGLRDSRRTSAPAFWASWADCLPDLLARFPAIARQMVVELSRLAGDPAGQDGPQCLVDAENAGRTCDDGGWAARPAWVDIASGLRPPDVEDDGWTLGEWKHGWQFHSGRDLEQAAYNRLERSLALPSMRSNAAALGKTRLQSCRGRFAPNWLITCPTSLHLKMTGGYFIGCVRFRLGLAVHFDGPDAHGFRRLADNTGGRLNARHSGMLAAWRQVLVEAGAAIPDDRVERMLRRTHVPVPAEDGRRLDIIAPGLNVAHGLPLFIDVTVLSPVSRNGQPRPGTSNRGGRLLEIADVDNQLTYEPVVDSGLGALYCLGCEVYGRWGKPCVDLVQAMVREKTRMLHPRIRRGTALGLQHRWWGILSISLQKAVAHAMLEDEGGDLYETLLEPIPGYADLPIL